MLEYILVFIIAYFLIGLMVMDGFMSNKYVYEGMCIYFKMHFDREPRRRDYFWMVLLSSYMWPKIVFANIVISMCGFMHSAV